MRALRGVANGFIAYILVCGQPAIGAKQQGITVTHDGKPVEGEWRVSEDGRELRFHPKDGWPAGSVEVNVPNSVRSAAGIELAEGRSFSFDATDQTDRVLEDWLPPSVERVAQEADGRLQVTFSEPMQAAGLSAGFELTERGPPRNGVPLAAALSTDGVTATLTPASKLTPDAGYDLALLAGMVKDRSGEFAAPVAWTWVAGEVPTRIWDGEETEPARASTAGNRFFFQGHESDPTTGLLNFRNRWYLPGLGRWMSRDSLGYSDGPNAYAAFGGDPTNGRDPFGLWTEEQWKGGGLLRRAWYSVNPVDGYQASEGGAVLVPNYGDWGNEFRAWLPEAKRDLKIASEIAIFGRLRAAAGYVYEPIGSAIGGVRGWLGWSALSNGTAAVADHAIGEAVFDQRVVPLDEGAKVFGIGAISGPTIELGASVVSQLTGSPVLGSGPSGEAYRAGEFRVGERLPDGRIAGAGPGAALRNGSEFQDPRTAIRGPDKSGRSVGQQQGRENRLDWLQVGEFDPSLPAHVRGWLRNERLRAALGFEPRNPPGYVLSHGRLTPAREGFDYSNSRFQGEDLNKLEERIRRRLGRP